MNMIEKVAVAISGDKFPSKESFEIATRAIKAMREPSDDMLIFGLAALILRDNPESEIGTKEIKITWQAMIDEEINE